jgi:hypothetical protein
MKKTIAIFLVSFCVAAFANAQDNALGVRLTNGAEVSYQRSLNDVNRLEFNLGWGWNTTSLSGFYHWVNPITEGFKWFIGPGAALGLFHSNTVVGLGGVVGIEYNFEVPLQLSLDWRPMLNFGNAHDGNYGSANVGLGIRYKF